MILILILRQNKQIIHNTNKLSIDNISKTFDGTTIVIGGASLACIWGSLVWWNMFNRIKVLRALKIEIQ